MALDEYLFGKIASYFKRRNKTSPEILDRTVYLEEIKPRLSVLARALVGETIEVFAAEKEGGFKQNNFFFPTSFALFSTYERNLSYYFFRLLYLSVQKKLKLNHYSLNEISAGEARQKAKESAPKVLAILFKEYPISETLFHDFENQLNQSAAPNQPVEDFWLFGKWMQSENELNGKKELNQFDDHVKRTNSNPIHTLLMAKAVENINSVEIDKKQQEDYVMTHNFEKVETADEHSSVWRDFDGEDELEEHQDALDELNMRWVVRVDDTAHSIYHSEFTENTRISESAERETEGLCYEYDEWDFSKRTYKKKYCKVYPQKETNLDAVYYSKTIADNKLTLQGLRKMLTSINNKMQQQRRQREGEEFELDTLCDVFVDIHSQQTPSENIYLSKRKKEKSISILLLLDLSLSSDGYADGNRVIDVEKQVSILFGEILHEHNIEFAIQGFYSKTRNYSTYISLKAFDEAWNTAKYKIGGIQPSGYTRIGAALRHSAHLLSKRNTQNKWLILLSDGKPNDYDQYEGKYGVQDVKQALTELNAQSISCFALAIEAQAKYYLPQMFGQNHYQIITTPVELLKSMVKLYEKIKYSSHG